MGSAILRAKKPSILIIYESDRELDINNRFIGPFIRLSRRGYKAYLVSTRVVVTVDSSFKCLRVKRIPFPVIPSLPFLLQTLTTLAALAKKEIELVVCFREVDLFPGWLFKRIKGAHLIYYAHGDGITVQRLTARSVISKVKLSLSIILEKILLPKADLVIAVSADTRLRLLNRVGIIANKTVVLYNNVLEYEGYSPTFLKKLKAEGKKVVGFVGHFSSLKGVVTLLRAFSLIAHQNNALVLVLVGDGPLRDYLKSLTAEMNLLDRVIFTGWVRNPIDFMHDFDLLVVPSLYEGCPSVILEAFSIGTPVFGSRAGGIPELLGFQELMFQPANYKELAKKIEEIFASDRKYIYVKKLIEERRKAFTFDHAQMLESFILKYLPDNSLINVNSN